MLPHPGPRERPPRAIGDYEILRRIGFGGMAEVFLARKVVPGRGEQEGWQKQVVVKRILGHHLHRPEFLAMFESEARLWALLDHRNIVQVFDFGREPSGAPYLVMQYVAGADLDRLQRAHGPFAPDVLLLILEDVAEALRKAHTPDGDRRPIVHRDVSPNNLLVDPDGTVMLTDFGISKALSSGDVTHTEVEKGKVLFFAPETLTDKVYDRRTDLFSLGVSAYVMLTGAYPFDGETQLRVMKAIVDGERQPVLERRPDCPPEVAALIDRLLAIDPDERFPTAEALLDALHGVRAALERDAHASGRPSRRPRRVLSDLVAQVARTEETPPEEAMSLAPTASVDGIPGLRSGTLRSGQPWREPAASEPERPVAGPRRPGRRLPVVALLASVGLGVGALTCLGAYLVIGTQLAGEATPGPADEIDRAPAAATPRPAAAAEAATADGTPAPPGRRQPAAARPGSSPSAPEPSAPEPSATAPSAPAPSAPAPSAPAPIEVGAQDALREASASPPAAPRSGPDVGAEGGAEGRPGAEAAHEPAPTAGGPEDAGEAAERGVIGVVVIPYGDVTLDGRPIRVPGYHAVDPGRHRIVARNGGRRIARTVVVGPGERAEVTLRFRVAR